MGVLRGLKFRGRLGRPGLMVGLDLASLFQSKGFCYSIIYVYINLCKLETEILICISNGVQVFGPLFHMSFFLTHKFLRYLFS